MAKSFKLLEEKMSPAARARSEVKKLIAEMPLNEMRAARELTQEHLAKRLRRTRHPFRSSSAGLTCTSAPCGTL